MRNPGNDFNVESYDRFVELLGKDSKEESIFLRWLSKHNCESDGMDNHDLHLSLSYSQIVLRSLEFTVLFTIPTVYLLGYVSIQVFSYLLLSFLILRKSLKGYDEKYLSGPLIRMRIAYLNSYFNPDQLRGERLDYDSTYLECFYESSGIHKDLTWDQKFERYDFLENTLECCSLEKGTVDPERSQDQGKIDGFKVKSDIVRKIPFQIYDPRFGITRLEFYNLLSEVPDGMIVHCFEAPAAQRFLKSMHGKKYRLLILCIAYLINLVPFLFLNSCIGFTCILLYMYLIVNCFRTYLVDKAHEICMSRIFSLFLKNIREPYEEMIIGKIPNESYGNTRQRLVTGLRNFYNDISDSRFNRSSLIYALPRTDPITSDNAFNQVLLLRRFFLLWAKIQGRSTVRSNLLLPFIGGLIGILTGYLNPLF